MKEIVERLAEELNKTITEDYEGDKPKFSREGYKTFEISKKNFHKLQALKDDKKIGFVDGGNTEILGSANFSLQLLRVYGCILSNNKIVSSTKNEFFTLIKSFGGEEIRYACEFFQLRGEVLAEKKDLELSSADNTIKEGAFNAKISKIGEIARRFAEIRMAEKIMDDLGEEDIIMLDGTLESNYTNEEKYLESLYEKAKQKKVLVTAIAKTTAMFTEKGNNLLGLLNNIGEEAMWYYYPIAETNTKNHKANLYVTKLNPKTRYVFRFESFKEQKNEINKTLGRIATNSKDFIFPGYPYGLIKADSLARVPNKEKEHYKTLFIAKTGKNGSKLEKYLNSGNAHSILDKQH